MKTARVLIALAAVIAALASTAFAYTSTLTWSDNSTNELGFIAERATARCAGAATWTTISTVQANTTTTTDPNVTPGSVYCYRVRAFNNSHTDGSGTIQYSEPSNLVDFTFPLVSPVAPAQLTVAPGK